MKSNLFASTDDSELTRGAVVGVVIVGFGFVRATHSCSTVLRTRVRGSAVKRAILQSVFVPVARNGGVRKILWYVSEVRVDVVVFDGIVAELSADHFGLKVYDQDSGEDP